jgi:hypothetical protein
MAGGRVDMKPRRGRKGGLVRALKWLAFIPVASRAPMYARLIWALVVDPRIPAGRKAVLAGAAGYVVLGRDLIPDGIPVLGDPGAGAAVHPPSAGRYRCGGRIRHQGAASRQVADQPTGNLQTVH